MMVYQLGVHIYLVLTSFITPFLLAGLMIVNKLGVHKYFV